MNAKGPSLDAVSRQLETLPERQTILAVDDAPENLSILANILKSTYRVLVATSGEEALAIAGRTPIPDLVLLDIVMPDYDGFEVCRVLKADPKTANIPVIFLTGYGDAEDEQTGLDLGAVDYITKPVSPALVTARVRSHLQVKLAQDFLRSQNSFLETEVTKRTKEISTIQDVTMVALGLLAETRDNETGRHIRRTQHFVRNLAEHASLFDPYHAELSEETIQRLFKSAPLHDIGKVGIPDHVLLKEGPLTPQEFELMKTHTTMGAHAIEEAERLLESPKSFLKVAWEIVISHHERWDGRGYPRGLAGNAIPLAGRIMALADVYDALRSERSYKRAFSHEKAVGEILGSQGQFDPLLLKLFSQIHEEWAGIYDGFESQHEGEA